MDLRSDRRGRAGTRPWGRHAVEAATGAGLVGLSLLLLSDRADSVPGWEVRAFEAVNGLPDWLRWPLWPPMQLGNFWMVALAGLGVYAATRRRRPALAASTAALLAWVAAKLVKDAVQRGRPGDLLTTVDVRESGLHGRGYVSGHTAIAFAVATVVTPLLPGRWRLLPFTLAGVVGFARIYYGAHLPLDVVGGAGIGILCGLAASLLFHTIDPVHDR
jgi:undecaprenyl-diphosphatase